MHQHHDHESRDRRGANTNRLAATLVLSAIYMVAELVGGWFSGSLALLADAGHMLSDVAALGLSLFASWIAHRPPTPQHSYGYYRAEILAALANGAGLVAISIFVFVEAAGRFFQPPKVDAPLMLAVALGGLAVNLAGMVILHRGKSESLNVHGAWLHVFTDALGSVATLVAGGLIWLKGWNSADPVASVLIGILVIYSSWNLLKSSITILMESTPRHLDIDEVRNALVGVPGVLEVHDLHIWTITSGMDSLSAHVVVREGHSHQTSLQEIREVLHHRFAIDHMTIQIEPDSQEECSTSFTT